MATRISQQNIQNKLLDKVKKITKTLFASKRGWLAILIANILWSMFWFPFLVMGWLTQDAFWYGLSGSIFLFFAQPLIPMWLIIPLTALAILKWLKPDSNFKID